MAGKTSMALLAAMSLYATGSVEELSAENFNEKVLDNPLPVVVDFYSEWCGPCMEMKPVFHRVCGEYEGRLSCKAYDTELSGGPGEGIAGQYNVNDLPQMVFFYGGRREPERQLAGGQTEEQIRAAFEDFLACH